MSTMKASDDLKDALYALKRREESYEDVVWRLLDAYDNPDAAYDPAEARAASEGNYPPEDDADLDAYDREGREELLADLDLPGSGDRLDARRETVGRMYDALRAEGNMTKQELLELVDPDAVDYASAESFWSNCIKGRESLAAITGVEAPAPGSTSAGWTWADPES